MKDKLLQAKEWLNKNKKKSIGIIVGLLVIIAAVGLGVWGVNNSQASENKAAASVDNDKKSTNNKSTEKQETEKKETEIAEEEAQSTVTAETEPAQQSQENAAAASSTQASSSQSSQDSTSSSSSSSSASSKKPTHTHNYNIPIYASRDVYVVDQAAWTETIEEPVYTTQIVWYCNTCGADITSDPGGHLDETMHGGYRSDVKQVQTGTTTRTINHPEQGHYETESYVSGYKCSCGSTK